MFIHFGLFSELGGVWKGKQYSGNYSEQIQSDAQIPEPEYAALASAVQSNEMGCGRDCETGGRRGHEVHCADGEAP